MSNTPPANLVPWSQFDPALLTVGPGADVQYGGRKLIVQTPVFERCFVGGDGGKYARDDRASVGFATTGTDFCERVGAPIEVVVRSYAASSCRLTADSFNTHIKPSRNPDRYGPIYNVTAHLSGPDLCKFYGEDRACISYVEFERRSRAGAGARALLEFGHVYVLEGRVFGVMCCARQIQCLPPPVRDDAFSQFAFVDSS